MSEVSGEPITQSSNSLCPHCGQQVQTNAAFCPHCGASLAAPDTDFKKTARRLKLAGISGSLMTLGALGACFSAIAGGAWLTWRFFSAYPLPALAVFVLIFWLIGGALGIFRLPRRRK